VLFHCALSLCSRSMVSQYGLSLCCLTVLSHCAVSLCCLTVLSHCALSLCSFTVLSHCAIQAQEADLPDELEASQPPVAHPPVVLELKQSVHYKHGIYLPVGQDADGHRVYAVSTAWLRKVLHLPELSVLRPGRLAVSFSPDWLRMTGCRNCLKKRTSRYAGAPSQR